MHNRAHVIVTSVLLIDLLIDWRWGEAWFMQNLLNTYVPRIYGEEEAGGTSWAATSPT